MEQCKWALGGAGRREPILPLRPQINKVAAASTVPVTSAVAQANSRMSSRILVIAAPCSHGKLPFLTAAAVSSAGNG
jgi:hypothetical protein